MLTWVVGLCPVGVELHCGSWPGLARTKVFVTVTAADGSQAGVGGSAEIEAIASAGAVQDTLEALLEQKGWDVRSGPNDTVIVFAPKGQSVKLVEIRSDGWMPGYKKILGPPRLPEKPKAKAP